MMRALRAFGLIAGISSTAAPAGADDPFSAERARMVADIAAMARTTAAETSRSTFSPRVMTALGKVPRHRLVPPDQVTHAYKNRPLSIGHGQTISQPFVVALMTDLLEAQPGDAVLEVGTGSGYQAAVLAELVARVYTIEIVAPIGKRAEAQLAELGYRNITVRIGDGYNGWPEVAPFDKIIVTAGAPHVPQPLVDQLKPGGRLVIPVNAARYDQELQVIEKKGDGSTMVKRSLPVRFVPLTREK
jgi:protein-L-isoaspartate(D-aspartate) O-methyltransferase